MKRWFLLTTCLLLVFALGADICTINAQDPDPPPLQGRPPLPLDGPLDANLFDAPHTAGLDPKVRGAISLGEIASWTKMVFQSYREDNWEIYLATGKDTNQIRLTRADSSVIWIEGRLYLPLMLKQ